jgi:hypothetical protein
MKGGKFLNFVNDYKLLKKTINDYRMALDVLHFMRSLGKVRKFNARRENCIYLSPCMFSDIILILDINKVQCCAPKLNNVGRI